MYLTLYSRDLIGGGLLSNISDILMQIADITPNKEFQAKVLRALDLAHIQQMIDRKVFGLSEILAVMDTIVGLLLDIQSDVRRAEYGNWYQQSTARFRDTTSSHEGQEILLNDVVVFLPIYFEMTMVRIEELQIEVGDKKDCLMEK